MAVSVVLAVLPASGFSRAFDPVRGSDEPGLPASAQDGGRGLSPELLARRDPGARVGGNTLVGSNGAERLFGVPRTDFIHGLGGDDVIAAGRGHDQAGGGRGDDRIAGGPGNDLLHGGAGDDVFVDGAGNDWMIDRQGATTVHVGAGNNRITVADGQGGDRVRCSSPGAIGVIDADRRDRIGSSCRQRGMRVRHDRRSSDALPAQARAVANGVRGDGSNENPYEADCDPGTTPTNCTVSSFRSRKLIGIWVSDSPPAYACPYTGKDAASKYLLNRTFVPWGTSVPNGYEVRGLGPIGITIGFFLYADGYAAGNPTGVALTSATNWSFGESSYQIVLHCTSDPGLGYRP
jgi:RTX calcium-binding nonapeptide repeat (4 copies)